MQNDKISSSSSTNNDGDDAINIIILFRPAIVVTVVCAVRGENVRNSRTFYPLLTAARTRGAQNLVIANKMTNINVLNKVK